MPWIIFQPKVVNKSDDVEFAKQLERLEQMNLEVPADDDNSGDETDSTTGGGNNRVANGRDPDLDEED